MVRGLKFSKTKWATLLALPDGPLRTYLWKDMPLGLLGSPFHEDPTMRSVRTPCTGLAEYGERNRFTADADSTVFNRVAIPHALFEYEVTATLLGLPGWECVPGLRGRAFRLKPAAGRMCIPRSSWKPRPSGRLTTSALPGSAACVFQAPLTEGRAVWQSGAHLGPRFGL